MRILLDLNLILDVLIDREPYAEESSALWAAIENHEAEGFLSAHCVTTLHCLAARSGHGQFGDQCVSDVLSVFGVAAVDRSVLENAVGMGWADFEDAVCVAAAVASGCQAVATRDREGFKSSTLPVLSAKEALAAIRLSPGRADEPAP
ncbi:MAG: PIN domain-containing protein [Deltaproteobacteria bacterium]|nr:PIN domain-containing protein [Deltaproteobacteria bacterium]